jgi:hypothetical protein
MKDDLVEACPSGGQCLAQHATVQTGALHVELHRREAGGSSWEQFCYLFFILFICIHFFFTFLNYFFTFLNYPY